MIILDHPEWLWLIAGVVLCAAELVAPGVFLLWIGFAAVTLGLIELIAPLPLAWSLLVFAALALAYTLVGRYVYGGLTAVAEAPLNDRAAALVGRELTLVDPIVRGEGRAQVLDSVWRVRGADAPAGARVLVTGVDGVVLRVEPV